MKTNLSEFPSEVPSMLQPSLSTNDSSIYPDDEKEDSNSLFKLRIVQHSKEMKTRSPKKVELMTSYKGMKIFYLIFLSALLF